MPPVAVLFARSDSVYKTLPGCDVWDIERDARKWPGGAPIVAHPPCRAWGRFRQWAKPREGEKELALWAVDQIRKFGGVLEHPAHSSLWKEKSLPPPGKSDSFGGWTLSVAQFHWGHKAEKKTWLYIVGVSPREVITPIREGEPEYVIASSKKRPRKKSVTHKEREATPPDFAVWLLDLANQCWNPAYDLV